MSQSWPMVRFEEVLDGAPRNGVSPATGGTVEEEVLTLSSITGNGFDASAIKVGHFKLSPSKAQRVSSSDLLICRGNGNIKLVGRGFISPEDRPDLVFPDTIIAAPLDKTRILPRYLEYVWNSQSVRAQIERYARTTNGTFKINQKMLKNIAFALPSIREQRRIVEVLGMADALRAKRRVAIALLDDLAQSMFLDMFGDPLGNPHGWPLRSLGEFFRVRPNYGTLIPGSSEAGEFLCLRVVNIRDWNIDLNDRKYVNLNPKDVERHTVVDGDLLMARAIASQEHLGKAIIARPGIENWAFDSHLMRLRFQWNFLLPEYVQALLRSDGGRRLFLKASRRSAIQYNINTKEMASLVIPLPPVNLQRLFTLRMDSIGKVKARHASALAGLDDLFGSLQQRAFRGELWDD